MSEQDGLILVVQTPDVLARWWCQLNHWEWPAELPDPETPEYRIDGNPRRTELMHWIEWAVGQYAILREGNRERMTDEQFADYWRCRWVGEPGPLPTSPKTLAWGLFGIAAGVVVVTAANLILRCL